MTVAGAVLMVLSLTGVIAAAAWCYYRVLTGKP